MTDQGGRRHTDGLPDQTIQGDVDGGASSGDGTGAGLQTVFIDASLPDAQMLASGVKPGVLAVLLDPGQDGVRQIADYLSAHRFENLAAIDIVAHGADGEMQLGSAVLSAATIGDHQAQLAQIGAALRPGGDILLYGCDIAQDATGDAFLQQLSQATGGANIAAASHLVGAAAEGGSFTLDVNVGSIDVASPFTADTVANVSGEFVLTSDQVFLSVGNGNTGTIDVANRIQQIGVNGSNAATNFVDLTDGSQNGDTINSPHGIVIDAPLQRFFTANGKVHNGQLYYGLFEGLTNASGGNSSLTEIYAVPTIAPGTSDATNGLDATINGIALDQPHGEIYFTQNVYDQITGTWVASETGIFKISVNGGAASPVFTDTIVTGVNVALDTKDNLVFFTAIDNVTLNNYLEVANLTTGSFHVLDTFTPDMNAGGVAVDTTNGTIYFTTQNFDTAASNGIFAAPFTVSGSGSTANASIGTVATLYSGSGAFDPSDIAIDVHDGIFFTTGGTQTTVAAQVGGVAGVFEGSLSHRGAGSLTQVFSMSTILAVSTGGSPGPAFNTTASNLFLESTPTVATNGTVTFVQGGTAQAIDQTITVTNADGQLLASASVAIAGFNSGDTLSADTTGTAIIANYNTATGVLALTGTDTIADYQAVLETVTFSTTGTTNTSHIIDWTVSDGIITSPASTATVNVHARPIVTAGTTVSFTGGGSAVTLDGTLALTNVFGTVLSSGTVTIGGSITGDTLNFTNNGSTEGNIVESSFSNGALVLTSAGNTATVAQWQIALRSVTYSFTPGGDPTGGGSHTSHTISWVVNDGVLVSTAATSTLNLIHVAPSISATGTTATFTGGGSAVALGDTVTITDPDSAGTLTSATVIISSGFISGDTLTVGTPGGIVTAFNNGTLTLTGAASISTYETALDSLQYSFTTGGDPTGGATHSTSRTISWFANDGVSNSNTTTTSLNIQHVAPTMSVSGTTSTFTGGGPAVQLDSGVTVSDPDSGGNLAGATVIIGGFITGDTLTVGTPGGIVTGFNNGTLTLTGTASLTAYQTALDSIQYGFNPPGGDPTNGGSLTSRTISWFASDGISNSGTVTSTVLTQQACYLAGTMIRTSRGEVAVEDLTSDDKVLTVEGVYRPILWLGRRYIDCTRHNAPEHVWPVRIMRDAISLGVPARDLYLSPDHAVFLDHMLVSAKYLLNGTTIVQVRMIEVMYYHVELDRHDVLLAEGLPVETYLDVGDRGTFENGGDPMTLHPDFAVRVWEAAGYAPLVVADRALAPLRQRINGRADLLGRRELAAG